MNRPKLYAAAMCILIGLLWLAVVVAANMPWR